jgi:high-affinity Fe2+/Pb2+ permease
MSINEIDLLPPRRFVNGKFPSAVEAKLIALTQLEKRSDELKAKKELLDGEFSQLNTDIRTYMDLYDIREWPPQ